MACPSVLVNEWAYFLGAIGELSKIGVYTTITTTASTSYTSFHLARPPHATTSRDGHFDRQLHIQDHWPSTLEARKARKEPDRHVCNSAFFEPHHRTYLSASLQVTAASRWNPRKELEQPSVQFTNRLADLMYSSLQLVRWLRVSRGDPSLLHLLLP